MERKIETLYTQDDRTWWRTGHVWPSNLRS